MPNPSADLKTIQDAIRADSPKLATLLEGPTASIALRALGKALLGDTEATAAEIANAASTADKLRIQAAEQEALLRIQQSNPATASKGNVDSAKLNPDPATSTDTDGARKMLIVNHDWTNRWLAIGVTIGFFILVLLLIWLSFGSVNVAVDANGKPVAVNPSFAIEPGYRDILFTLLGVVATGWANIIGFYFGSSAGSMQKSLAINAALDKTITQAGQDAS